MNNDHYQPKTERKVTYRRPDPEKLQPPGQSVFKWLQGRGISETAIHQCGVKSSRIFSALSGKEEVAIAFPYVRNGETINVKYRMSGKQFQMEKGAERIFYGLDDINPDCVVIVEGEIDKLSLSTIGIQSCISVPDGAPSAESKDYGSKFTFLESAESQLEAVKKFILAVDGDAPGKRLEEELARRLGFDRCFRVVWPTGCKDANDVLATQGSAALRDCLEHVAPYPVSGVNTVRDMRDRIEKIYQYGFRTGKKTGWPNMDDLYTVREGEWTLVTGVPSHGKSTWLDNLLVNLARNEGWRFAMFSPENHPMENHIARLIPKASGVPFREGITPRIGPEDLAECLDWLETHFWWIYPEGEVWTIENILAKAKSLVVRNGINGLVIDPWNELDHSRPNGLSETEQTSLTLSKIRQFARQHDIHVWVVAHPTKLRRNDDGTYPVPTPYDVSGSAHFNNKADNAITIYRNPTQPDKPTQIHVQKIRFREIGQVGVAELAFDRVTERYLMP